MRALLRRRMFCDIWKPLWIISAMAGDYRRSNRRIQNSLFPAIILISSPIIANHRRYMRTRLKETWYRQIGDKVKNELRNEKSDPIVLSRKRKCATPPTKAKRGIVSWEPHPTEGEDEVSSKLHTEWMQKEFKKREPNMTLVSQKLTRTYSFRRRYVNEGSHTLEDMKDKYSFIFLPQHVYSCIHKVYSIIPFGNSKRREMMLVKLKRSEDVTEIDGARTHNVLIFRRTL